MTDRVVAVIQARMGSTRLPGKVLRPLGGRTVLDWVIDAAQTAVEVDDVVVATSTARVDDAIEHHATSRGIGVVRGSEVDVLSRFVLAAEESRADAVVRLTADCPMLDPQLIDHVVRLWRDQPDLGYVSTTLVRTLPRGLDVELVSRSALRQADVEAMGHDRVHVTSHLYGPRSDVPRAGIVFAPPRADLRVTLDVPEDAALLDALVARLADTPSPWRAVVEILDADPELVRINSAVRQKSLDEG